MNHIKIQKVMIPNGYEEDYWCIDGKILTDYLDECITESADESVRNVVDVTILERLSDEDTIWQRFGKIISSEFKCYINQEVLVTNLMMCGVKSLE